MRIAFGTMALTGLYDPGADLSTARQALQAGLDGGVRVLHAAFHYGDGAAFRLIRETVPDRAGVRLIVKVDGDPDRLLGGAEGAANATELLGRGGLDVQLVESAPGLPSHTSLDDILADLRAEGPRSELLAKARADGIAARIGIEAYHPGHVESALAIPLIDFVVADMSIMRQVVPPDAVPPRIASGEVELVAIRPLAGGWLTDRYRTLADFAPADNRREWYFVGERYRPAIEKVLRDHGLGMVEGALRYLQSLPYARTIVVGMRTPGQVADALDPRMAMPLPEAAVRDLAGLFAQPVILEFD